MHAASADKNTDRPPTLDSLPEEVAMNDRQQRHRQPLVDRRREMELLWRAIDTEMPDTVDSGQPDALRLFGDLRELQARVRFRLRLHRLKKAREQGRSRILGAHVVERAWADLSS